MPSRTYAKTVRAILEGMTIAARHEALAAGALYEQGVVYQTEPRGEESFSTPLLVKERGYGDCADLSLWRVAELRNAGVPAAYDIYIQHPSRLRRVFHVRVRLPDGRVEDPSVKLGMRIPEGMVVPL